MISKTMQTILHALSYGNIEVEASRRLADIKRLDAMRIFVKKLDTKYIMELMKCLCGCISRARSHERRAGRGRKISCAALFSWWWLGDGKCGEL